MLMPTTQNTKTVTDLRERAVELLSQLKKGGPTYIFLHNKPKAVMLSMEEYQELLETLEDYTDALSAKEIEANPEKGGKTISQLAKKYNLNV